MSEHSQILRDIQKEIEALRNENASLKEEVSKLKTAPTESLEIDSELMEALAEFDQDVIINGNQIEAKKELLALLDDLEEMINSMNATTDMGLQIPQQLNEIRNSLNTNE